MGNSSWRARARLHRVWSKVAAVAGLSLVASMTTLAPAQAGLLGEVTPVIEAGAAGSIESFGVTVCESDGSVRTVCEALSLDLLGSLSNLVLTAVPADPASNAQWTEDCPDAVGDICTISLDLLSGASLQPVAQFVPGLPGAEPPADEAPDTEIDPATLPDGESASHTWQFRAVRNGESLSDSSFRCKLDHTPEGGTALPGAWESCGTPVAAGEYTHSHTVELEAGTYTFSVEATADSLTDESPASHSWVQTESAEDGGAPPEVPETRIAAGPKNRAFVLTPRATFSFRSTVEGSQFQCWYDDLTNACDTGRFTWGPRMLRPGQHTFKVAAMANKTQDFTPAVRTFNVPLDDRALRAVKHWQRKKQRGHVRNTYSLTTVKGAALVTKRPQKFRRVVLVADKGRGFGSVKVFKGKQLLREVDLHAKKKLVKRKVIPIKRFRGKLRAGGIRVVVTSAGKPVRIDGIGVARR